MSQSILFIFTTVLIGNGVFAYGLGLDWLFGKSFTGEKRSLPHGDVIIGGLWTTLVLTVTSPVVYTIWYFLPDNMAVWGALIYVAVTAFFYLLIRGGLRFIGLDKRPVLKKIAKLLPRATFNTAVLGAFITGFNTDLSLFEYMGYCSLMGLGLILAGLIVCDGVKRLSLSNVPRPFRGLPVILIYLGIISMAFLGFAV